MLLHEIVSKTASERPDSAAVVSRGEKVSYRQLDDLSGRLARLLAGAGCRKGDRVGVLAPKSIQAIVGFLGTLKAGCVYVPMDTASPAARLAKVLDACEPRVILADDAASALLCDTLKVSAAPDPAVGWLSKGNSRGAAQAAFSWNDLDSVAPSAPPCETAPGDAAHILFTSGSTGTPKGVVITHANVLQFITWATRYFGTAPDDRISAHPPLHFDLSTFDIYGTFLAGAELHLVPPEISLLPQKLADFIRSSRLTQWFSVPSALKYMAQFDVVRPGDFPSLRRLLWCGEALPTPTLIHLMDRLPHVTFHNLYGPTETTIASSYYTVPDRPADANEPVPIGSPCEGETLHVLDESLNQAAPGEVGDLYIGGAGLSPGYWRDPEKTAAVFLEHPAFGRIYKTGDLARVGDGGLVYLLGRADSQIKSRGYRIELGEIEAALHALGILRESAVVAVETGGFEGKEICCAYVPEPGTEIDAADLRQRLTGALPLYMMPSRWRQVDSLPLNGNGKVDRPALRLRFQAESTTA